jgi:hypothetical protein
MTHAYASSEAHCVDPYLKTFDSLGGTCDTISLIFAYILLKVNKKIINEACKKIYVNGNPFKTLHQYNKVPIFSAASSFIGVPSFLV